MDCRAADDCPVRFGSAEGRGGRGGGGHRGYRIHRRFLGALPEARQVGGAEEGERLQVAQERDRHLYRSRLARLRRCYEGLTLMGAGCLLFAWLLCLTPVGPWLALVTLGFAGWADWLKRRYFDHPLG